MTTDLKYTIPVMTKNLNELKNIIIFLSKFEIELYEAIEVIEKLQKSTPDEIKEWLDSLLTNYTRSRLDDFTIGLMILNEPKTSWTKEEIPIDPMLNLIGFIDNPMGRKSQHPDIVSQVQELKKWIEENNLNYLK